MTEQDTENTVANDKPENEVTEEPLHELESEQSKRVKITEVIKQPTEFNDCKKPMTVKTLRYSHPNVCEKKPSNIIDMRVKNYAPRAKTNINVEPLAPETQQNNLVEPQNIKKYNNLFQKPCHPNHDNNLNNNLKPYANLTQQQFLQLQMKSMNAEIMRRKQEKSDNMCQAMFQSRSKNLNNNIYKS